MRNFFSSAKPKFLLPSKDFPPFVFDLPKRLVILQTSMPTLRLVGVTRHNGKRHYRFVFELFERRKLKSLSKTNAEGDANGCVYVCSRGVPRAFMPSRTLLGVSLYVQRGYRLCSFIERASYGLNSRTGRCRYPVFRYVLT